MMTDYRKIINEELIHNLTAYKNSEQVLSAMTYALNNGGKRIRPILLLSLLNDFNIDYHLGLNAACALEMIHTYSLIHDDLPAMDNDDFRRNNPTVHKKYNEAIAILAGDALLTEAFNVAINEMLSAEQNIAIIKALASYSGLSGMIYGQELDLASEGEDLKINELIEMHKYKTGKLLALPLVIACIIAKQEQLFKIVDKIGILLGRAFQIQDDIFDVTKSLAELGKDTNSDSKNQKCTYTTIMSIDDAEKECQGLYLEVEKLINDLSLNDNQTLSLIKSLRTRQY